eukprot:6182951-Pleurochrysis_carterae.AAC.2
MASAQIWSMNFELFLGRSRTIGRMSNCQMDLVSKKLKEVCIKYKRKADSENKVRGQSAQRKMGVESSKAAAERRAAMSRA